MLIEGTVLLVDDEEAVIEFERDVLAGAGAQVVTLMNWDEVKLRLVNQQFDAVIMNGKMPGGSNLQEVYEWISKNCPGLESHLLFTFSSLTEPEERSFLQENNVPHLVKPFEVGDLIAHARRMLQKTQAAVAG
jgi:DNA-binding NtrC family response regulator